MRPGCPPIPSRNGAAQFQGASFPEHENVPFRKEPLPASDRSRRRETSRERERRSFASLCRDLDAAPGHRRKGDGGGNLRLLRGRKQPGRLCFQRDGSTGKSMTDKMRLP